MDCNRDTLYPSILFIFLFWLKVSSLFPVFQGLAGEFCRFYSILISTDWDKAAADTSTSVDTSVFVGYPRPDEKKIAKKKKNVSQVLESKFVIFIISRFKSENGGLWGAQSGFFNKGKLVILRNATTLYNQSWPLFSSAVMALYWDPVPFILIGRFMKNNAMSAHGKDWTQPPVLDLPLYHWSVFGFKSSTRGRLSAFAF